MQNIKQFSAHDSKDHYVRQEYRYMRKWVENENKFRFTKITDHIHLLIFNSLSGIFILINQLNSEYAHSPPEMWKHIPAPFIPSDI
jgi:hypothetical protein